MRVGAKLIVTSDTLLTRGSAKGDSKGALFVTRGGVLSTTAQPMWVVAE